MYIDFHLGQLIVYGHDKRTSEKVGSRTSKESLNSSKDGLRHSAIAKEKGRLLLLIYHMLLSVLLTFNQYCSLFIIRIQIKEYRIRNLGYNNKIGWERIHPHTGNHPPSCTLFQIISIAKFGCASQIGFNTWKSIGCTSIAKNNLPSTNKCSQ